MKDDIKAQWLADLRSGQYPQGKDLLRDRDGHYCCLGVLCAQAERAGVVTPYRPAAGSIDEFDGAIGYGNAADPSDASATALPAAVVRWAGLDDENPTVVVADEARQDCLGELNDSGHSFAEIADLIEEQL